MLACFRFPAGIGDGDEDHDGDGAPVVALGETIHKNGHIGGFPATYNGRRKGPRRIFMEQGQTMLNGAMLMMMVLVRC